MKRIVIISVLVVLVGFTTYKLFIQNSQSSPKELKAVFDKAVKMATTLQMNNPYKAEKEALLEWEINVTDSSIEFRQHPSWDCHSADEYKQYMVLSLKDDKIILKQYDFADHSIPLGEYASICTFGSAYEKFREFKNAKDFLRKFTKFSEDLPKFKTGEYSCQSLILSHYYPACTWRNLKMSFHDDKKGNKYPY